MPEYNIVNYSRQKHLDLIPGPMHSKAVEMDEENINRLMKERLY